MSEHTRLKPLKDRVTPKRLEYLMDKREYRRLLSVEHAKTRGLALTCLQVLQRGFWGRLKWLFLGR